MNYHDASDILETAERIRQISEIYLDSTMPQHLRGKIYVEPDLDGFGFLLQIENQRYNVVVEKF
jgi:hypothetical protein